MERRMAGMSDPGDLLIELSEKTDLLIPALFASAVKIEPILKTLTNDFLGSKYAGLPEVLNTIKPILQENNIFASAMITSPGVDGIRITLRFMHISGQWERFSAMFPAEIRPRTSGIQSAGASITYAIRYLIGSYFLIPFEDTDGPKPPKPPKTKPENKNGPARSINRQNIITAINKDITLSIEQKTGRIKWLNGIKTDSPIEKAVEKWGY
jgi:hypothetical protein